MYDVWFLETCTVAMELPGGWFLWFVALCVYLLHISATLALEVWSELPFLALVVPACLCFSLILFLNIRKLATSSGYPV